MSAILFRSRVKSLRPRPNGQHFADDILKRIFFHENAWVSIKISLKFVPKSPINNIPALVQIRLRLGASQATGHYLNQRWLVYWRIYASPGLNELMLSIQKEAWVFQKWIDLNAINQEMARRLVVITGTINMVTLCIDKPLKRTTKSGSPKWNLRVLDL